MREQGQEGKARCIFTEPDSSLFNTVLFFLLLLAGNEIVYTIFPSHLLKYERESAPPILIEKTNAPYLVR